LVYIPNLKKRTIPQPSEKWTSPHPWENRTSPGELHETDKGKLDQCRLKNGQVKRVARTDKGKIGPVQTEKRTSPRRLEKQSGKISGGKNKTLLQI
jgi:hypothetical protein